MLDIYRTQRPLLRNFCFYGNKVCHDRPDIQDLVNHACTEDYSVVIPALGHRRTRMRATDVRLLVSGQSGLAYMYSVKWYSCQYLLGSYALFKGEVVRIFCD